MIKLSKPHLTLLVSALDDAIKYNEIRLKNATNNIANYEEHLYLLENFQNWLEEAYKNLEQNNNMMKYDTIINAKNGK